MADEVDELEHELADLGQDLRATAVVPAHSPRDAEAMASVLSVISAIERVGDTAVEISWIVTRRLGIRGLLLPTCPRPKRCRIGYTYATPRIWPIGRCATSNFRR